MNVSKIISSTEASPFEKHIQIRSLLLPKNAEGDAFINNLNQYLKIEEPFNTLVTRHVFGLLCDVLQTNSTC